MATNQGKLRGVLFLSYLLLIILLMLANCHGCDRTSRPIDDDDAVVEEVVPMDTVAVEERAEQVGGDGEIKVTALWDFPGDVDLHVTQPNGRELWFQNMKDRSTGGELDVDNIPGGRGSAENVFWTNPQSGTYVVDLVLYNVSDSAPYGGTVNVVIKVGDHRQTIPVRLSTRGQRVRVKSFSYRR